MAIEPKLRLDSPVYKFLPRLVPPSIGSEEAQVAPAPPTSSKIDVG